MSQSDQEIVVQVDELREFVRALYRKAGVRQEHAELMAELQVETDLRGGVFARDAACAFLHRTDPCGRFEPGSGYSDDPGGRKLCSL